jgi:GT2 family glycosyltransferase
MTDPITNVSVVIATKGRPRETGVLLAMLARQTRPPERVIVIGADDSDIATGAPPSAPFEVLLWKAASPGLTIQRNEAVRWLRAQSLLRSDSIVVFFDDDFRPADNWIENCIALFADPDLVGMTGRVLADGIVGAVVTEDDATAFLTGARPPQPHWASGLRRSVSSVYGCNMAFAGRVLTSCLFDESLPLYGWQEDRDMTGQAKKFGKVQFSPECCGVHLGASGGRTNGKRLGYSQIANMVYLKRKGTVEWTIAARFLLVALTANVVWSVYRRRDGDRINRLKGNCMALADLARGRCEPRRILNIP